MRGTAKMIFLLLSRNLTDLTLQVILGLAEAKQSNFISFAILRCKKILFFWRLSDLVIKKIFVKFYCLLGYEINIQNNNSIFYSEN
jgi:hypothetical protein